ncbi:hypothetical protein Avbf_02999 [Armadillidium vulgare]|nr:hypothetical protein Avbf_02999 [Armadillidium vulgare]
MKMLETEMQIEKDAQSNVTSQHNDFKMDGINSNAIFSSSGPFLILGDKNPRHQEIANTDSVVNLTKNKSKSNGNSKPVTENDIHSQERVHLKKLCKTSHNKLKSLEKKCLINSENSVNGVEHTKEKSQKKRKRRQHKGNKNSNHDLDCKTSLKKQNVGNKSNSDHNSGIKKKGVYSCEPQIHLPVDGSSNVNSKAISKNIKKEKIPLDNKKKGNWTVSDIGIKNNLKSIVLPAKGNIIQEKKNDIVSVPKESVTQKRNIKRKREESSTHKMMVSNSLTNEHHGKAEKNLKKDTNNDERNRSNKNVISNKIASSSNLVEKLSKKRRRKPKCYDKLENCDVQQNRLEPKVVNSLSTLKERTTKTTCSKIKIIEGVKASVKKINKGKESEVDEASGSDNDIVPNDLKSSMFTKEETRAYHQLQLKELKENEKRQKMKVIFGKGDSEISNSVGKLKTDKAEGRKSPSKCIVDSQDIGLSSLYKKINKKEVKNSLVKSGPQKSGDEILPYGDDKIEDLEIVFSTIKKDLKTKFACDIKKELPSEEDSISSVIIKKSKPMKKMSANTESHPDNLFNIYSKNDDISIISFSEPRSSNLKNSVKKSVNNNTKKLAHELDTAEKKNSCLGNVLNDGMLLQIGTTETDITENQKTDKMDSPCVISKNQSVLNEKNNIKDDFLVKHNSSIDASNVEAVCNDDKQVCNDQQINHQLVLSDEDENEKVESGLTVNEIETLDTSQCNLRKEEDCRLYTGKETMNTQHEDVKESEKSFTIILDESSDDLCTIEVDGKEKSVDKKKLSETKGISKNKHKKILKENIEASTFEIIDCTIENTDHICKEVLLEQRYDKENIEDKDINKTMTLNEIEIPTDVNVIPDQVSDTLVNTENSKPNFQILDQNAESSISKSVDSISNNVLEVSNEKSMKKIDQVNEGNENSVDDILEPKSPHRKALTFEVLENSSECGSEMSKLDDALKLQNQNKENSENKENIVNNKQEEIVEMSSFASSNSINDEFSKNENQTNFLNESPKINMTKYKSPAKRKSFGENSPGLQKNIICLTPLKVASAALSNEIIISPDVSDEENTARAVNTHIEEESIFPSISESVVTLNQTSHEEEQIRDENEICSYEDESHTKLLKEAYNYGKSENLRNSTLEVLELSPVSITSSQSKQSPNLPLPTDKLSDLLQEDPLKNSTISNVTRKLPLVRAKNSPKNDSVHSFDENDELPIEEVTRKRKYSDNIEASNSELKNSVEPLEELENKDKVSSLIKTRYSLRTRNVATPEKEMMKPLRRRRNSGSSVKSENEIGVVNSPSVKSKRTSLAGNLTPVRRSRRISELSLDKN